MREDVDLNIRSAVKKIYDKPNQTIENCQALDLLGGWEARGNLYRTHSGGYLKYCHY